ncbi:MAG: hypothetical protein QNK36_06895 [Colwellia sp.]|nr:hypothetical protein [Colwellia sp.]
MSYQDDRDNILKEYGVYQSASTTLGVVLFLILAGVVWFTEYALLIVIVGSLILCLAFYFVRTARKNNLACSNCDLNLVPIVLELKLKSDKCYCPACGKQVI